MVDITLEVMRALIVGAVLVFLARQNRWHSLREVKGWRYIVGGFALIFFGMLVDITDNFDSLNRFVVIGDTEWESFLEKVVGYLFGFLLLAIGFWQWLPKIVEHDRQVREKLQQATATVKALEGLLPICANCKKIRDDQGSWQHIELYISRRAEVDFTHGICPDCERSLYPEFAATKDGQREDAASP